MQEKTVKFTPKELDGSVISDNVFNNLWENFNLCLFSALDQRPLDKNEKVCTLCSPPIRANGTNTNGRICFPALFFTIPHNCAFVASYDLLVGLFAFVRV